MTSTTRAEGAAGARGRRSVPQRPVATPVAPRALLVGAVGTAIMLVGITRPSLWTDEAATISAAQRPLGELWRMAQTIDAVHTAYYFVMHGWIEVFGASELALRSLSALAVGVGAAGTYTLARLLVTPTVGLWAGAAFVLLPRVAWMGVEARPFALATAAGVWATVVLWFAVRRGRLVSWLGYGALVTVAVLLNLYLALLVVAHAVTLWPHRAEWRKVLLPWAASAGTAACLTLPMALTALTQQRQIGENPLGLLELVRNVLINQWFLGETPTIYSRADPAQQLNADTVAVWQLSSAALAATSLLLVITMVARQFRQRPSPPALVDLAWWTVPWLVVPTVAMIAITAPSSTYNPRYLAFVTPALAIVLAAALAGVRSRLRRVLVGALLVVLAIPVLASQRTEHAKSGADWREIAGHVAAHAEPDDGVYFTPRYPDIPGPVRLTTRGVSVAYPEPFADLADITLLTTPEEAGDLVGRSAHLTDSTERLAAVDRVWVIRRHDYSEGARRQDDDLLRREGFVPTRRWAGPLDELVLLTRR